MVAIRALTGCLTADQKIINITSVLALLYPPALLMAGQSYSHAYAQLCLVILALTLLRGWHSRRASIFAVAGLVFGLGCLIRPSMLSLWVVFAGILMLAVLRGWATTTTWNVRGLLCAAAAFVIAFIVVVAPVVLGNHARGAGLSISTNNERNFFLGNNRYTPNYKTSHLAQRPLASLEPEISAYLKSIYGSPNRQNVMLQEAIDYIRAHPDITLWRTLNRIRAFWGFDYLLSRQISKFYSLNSVGMLALLVLEAGGYILVMVGVIVGVFQGWASVAQCRGFVVALILGYQIPYAVAFASGTYHFPVMGLILPFAGVGVRFLANSGSLRKISRWTWVCILLFGLLQIEYAYHAIDFAPKEQ